MTEKTYHEVVYGNYKKSNYPEQLAIYLERKCFSKCWSYIDSLSNPFDLAPITLLDLGCGDKTYVNEFNKLGFKTVGIDSSTATVSGRHMVDDVMDYYKRPFDFNKDKLPYKNNSFDIVFTKSVIEHIGNTEYFLKEAYRVLKEDGILVVLTPAWEFNYRWFYDDPTHVKPFHRKGLQDALKMSGFDVDVEYLYHLPFFWKYPKLKFLASLVRLLPDDWRWKDFEQQHMNVGIRFCKEVQLLAIAYKGKNK